MIYYLKGNLFNKFDKVEAIINTVNCVGVMGKGIALEFKNRFPENYTIYKERCNIQEIQIGNSFLYEIPSSNATKYIINFPTKKHWRNPSKLEYIEHGLDNLITLIRDYKINSIAMPALGCGNGQLEWDSVKPLIEEKLQHLKDIDIYVFEPSEVKNNNEKNKMNKPRLTADRKKLLLIMNDYNNNTKGPLITHIEINIFSYFLYFKNQNINFELKHNGPFHQDIKKIIVSLNPYYIEPISVKSANSGTEIKVKNTNFPQKKVIISDPDYLYVKSLITGFESYNGLLVLSLTHWFRFKEKTPVTNLEEKISEWLDKNNHIVDSDLISKAMNRIEKLHHESENLSFKLF